MQEESIMNNVNDFKKLQFILQFEVLRNLSKRLSDP